jgi:hypothetical protein
MAIDDLEIGESKNKSAHKLLGEGHVLIETAAPRLKTPAERHRTLGLMITLPKAKYLDDDNPTGCSETSSVAVATLRPA